MAIPSEIGDVLAIHAEARKQAFEEAAEIVRNAGWYRTSDDRVSWEEQEAQIQHSVDAVLSLK